MTKEFDKEYEEFLEWKKFKELKKGNKTTKLEQDADHKKLDQTKKIEKPIYSNKLQKIKNVFKGVKVADYIITSITIAFILSSLVLGIIYTSYSYTREINYSIWNGLWIPSVVFSSIVIAINIVVGIISYIKPDWLTRDYKKIFTYSSIALACLITSSVMMKTSLYDCGESLYLSNHITMWIGLCFNLLQLIFISLSTFDGYVKIKKPTVQLKQGKKDNVVTYSALQNGLIKGLLITLLSFLGVALIAYAICQSVLLSKYGYISYDFLNIVFNSSWASIVGIGISAILSVVLLIKNKKYRLLNILSLSIELVIIVMNSISLFESGWNRTYFMTDYGWATLIITGILALVIILINIIQLKKFIKNNKNLN